MTTYTVSYDLIKNKDYERLWAELERMGGQRAQDSYWLVASSKTARDLLSHLLGFIDGDDSMWVSELTRNASFNNSKKGTNAWLERNPRAR